MFSLNLVLAILLLGFRHGLDIDHVAAISDIVSSTKNSKRAIINGFVYAVAHAVMVIFLGILAIVLGVSLPAWVDKVIGPLVGFTLIILGLWTILSVVINKRKFKLMSRWMMLFEGIAAVYNYLLNKHEHHHIKYPRNFGIKTSYLLGTIHGIGAETPTQILLFVTSAGIGGAEGSLLLLIFVLGLLMSNSIILFLSVLGFIRIKRFRIYSALGILAGIMSLIVGTILLMGPVRL